ncbi:MAG: uroporphyrinogen-III C-methyltransferase [Actinobacteria bacterium]|nr:uroporphyrinogen-III C-methyltransferase [Actinomycetota bacterium]
MTGPLSFGGPPAAPGVVYLVGGGPGDPGLLTVRAARLLSTAGFVAHDRLSPSQALALCPDGCERVDVGKLPDRHGLSQDEIGALLVERAARGQAVVRLKGGDPFVLGRGSEEAQACAAAGVPFEVVPAVTSAVAAPAYAGIPITHRGVAPGFAVVAGHEDPTKPAAQVDYAALAAFPGTLALLMGVGRIGAIAGALMAAGKPADTPVALVRRGTTPRQETLVTTLADVGEAVAAAGFGPPAVAVVGDVVGLRDRIAWFESDHAGWVRERRPLHGCSVLVPRTRQQAGELSRRLAALGAEPVEAPTIAIEPTRDRQGLRRRLRELGDGAFDWVAFTSANGVRAVSAEFDEMGADARLFAPTAIAVVGPGTADAVRRAGLRPDLVPPRYTTAGLAEAMVAGAPPASALLPRADIATPTLARGLRDAGWRVTEVEAYRTVAVRDLDPGVRRRLEDGDVDVIAFPSSSTVRNFVDLLGGQVDDRVRVAAIGPVTAGTCVERGLRVDAVARPHDLDGLVGAVVAAARTPAG